MTRPQIIRADTIDLQDQESPSAKDHSRQPTNPTPLGEGPPAPHQAIALKNAGLDGLEIHSRSPRASQDLSGKELQLLQDHPDADDDNGVDVDHHGLNGQRNGDVVGANGENGDMGDGEGDDSLDDDMMDKISSSPSIDGGGYHQSWRPREDSLFSVPFPVESVPEGFDSSCSNSSSPTISLPTISLRNSSPPPISLNQQLPPSPQDHQQGEYREDRQGDPMKGESYDSELLDHLMPLVSEATMLRFQEEQNDGDEHYDADFEEDNLDQLLLPSDDPLLDKSFDDIRPLSSMSSESGSTNSGIWDGPIQDRKEDDSEDISFLDERFVDSGWGGECLRETEDISFEFVYALHTFVATVEGQANASKGDTMVLLDDSNSYWWLVRVVKDSSIGYLPAEHIETPTERLARLNKHRNIDLSQTMLGDNPEKSKNPLKKAMRRRNAKTVQFTAPTYYEPSDNEYSSDEEDQEIDFVTSALESGQPETQEEVTGHDDGAVAEPIKVRSIDQNVNNDEINEDPQIQQDAVRHDAESNMLRTSEEIFDRQDDLAGKSRKGTVRNTDSFFKDDTIETRKINLTPSLLRDDSSASTLVSGKESFEGSKPRGSFDTILKDVPPAEKSKDDKRKEKKSGMLSGLFKRKDRKSKAQGDDEDSEMLAKEISSQSTQPKISSDIIAQDGQIPQPSSPGKSQPQRQASKLQKPQPNKGTQSPKRSQSTEPPVAPKSFPVEQPIAVAAYVQQHSPSASLEKNTIDETDNPFADQPTRIPPPVLQIKTSDGSQDIEPPPHSSTDSRRVGMFSPLRDVLRSNSSIEPKVERVKKAKERMVMDDSDSSPEVENAPDQTHFPIEQHEEIRYPAETSRNRLSESPVQVSPIVHAVHPPGLDGDTSSQERSISPVSPSSTPELVEAPQEESVRDAVTPASTTQLFGHAATWSDASLRTYLEDDTDIRDLLVVVHDKSNVKPAGPDHPVVKTLYQEESRRLDDMSNRLDGLLQDLISRKSQTTTTK